MWWTGIRFGSVQGQQTSRYTSHLIWRHCQTGADPRCRHPYLTCLCRLNGRTFHTFCERTAQTMDRYGELVVFTRAVADGGFSAAARSLSLTPSAVSKLVSRLEDR